MMKNRSSRRGAVALVLAGALALTGCATGTPPADEDTSGPTPTAAGGELDELIAAAQAEGELVWYQTANEAIAQRVAEAFGEKYDLDVSFNRLNSSQMEQRFSAEMEAGAPAADVIIPLHSEFFLHAMEEGWVTPLAESDIPDYPAANLPDQAILEDDGTAIIQLVSYAFAWNTDLVSEDEVPTTWPDLLDSRWDGQILMSDPTISQVYTELYYTVMQEYGIEFLEDLGAKQPRIYQGAAPMGESLAAGEGSLAIPLPGEFVSALRDGRDAPLDWKLPTDVSIGAASVVGIVADAAHPNAARLFAHWLMSEEGLEVFAANDGTINPMNLDEWPSVVSGPSLAEQAAPHKDEIYTALGF